MTKNMTLSIDDKLYQKMEAMAEVNWSQVARDSFASYIATRNEPEISDIIEKLTKERSQQYAKGFNLALDYAKHNTYEAMESLLLTFDEELHAYDPESKTEEEHELLAVKHTMSYRVIGPSHKTQELLRGFLAGLMKIKKGLGD